MEFDCRTNCFDADKSSVMLVLLLLDDLHYIRLGLNDGVLCLLFVSYGMPAYGLWIWTDVDNLWPGLTMFIFGYTLPADRTDI